MRRCIVWGLAAASMAIGAFVNLPAARADSFSKVVTIHYPGPNGGTKVSAYDVGESGDYACVTYWGQEFTYIGVLTDCALGEVVVDDLLRTASVRVTVQLRGTGETVVVDTTHTGLQPTTDRRPTFYAEVTPDPRSTNPTGCFVRSAYLGTYEYSLWLSRDATTEGTATRAGTSMGAPTWADLHRYQSSNRQAIRHC